MHIQFHGKTITVSRLSGEAIRHPGEFWDHVRNTVRVHPEHSQCQPLYPFTDAIKGFLPPGRLIVDRYSHARDPLDNYNQGLPVTLSFQ